jgi:hypothetical protein
MGALGKGPDLLVNAPLFLQDVGAIVLLCWALSFLVMIGRFFRSSNGWVDWTYPSFGQLIVDFKERLTRVSKKP